MPDLSEQLSAILQNPQAQESIRSLIGMLGQPPQNAQAPPAAPPPAANQPSQPSQPAPPLDFSALLGSLQQSQPPPPPPCNTPPPLGGIDINSLMKIQQIFSKMNCDDKNVCLLRALRPYLKDPRKADDAINMLRLLSVLPALRDCGIFGGGNT